MPSIQGEQIPLGKYYYSTDRQLVISCLAVMPAIQGEQIPLGKYYYLTHRQLVVCCLAVMPAIQGEQIPLGKYYYLTVRQLAWSAVNYFKSFEYLKSLVSVKKFNVPHKCFVTKIIVLKSYF